MAPAFLAGLLQLPAKKEDDKPPTLPGLLRVGDLTGRLSSPKTNLMRYVPDLHL